MEKDVSSQREIVNPVKDYKQITMKEVLNIELQSLKFHQVYKI